MTPRTLLFPFLLVAPLFAQGEVDLRTTAKKGSSVWLVNEQKQEQNIDMGGQQMETGNTTNRVLQITIKDIDDKGNLVVETNIARVYGSASIPMMGDVEFDSASPEDGDEDDGMMGMMKKGIMTGAGKTFTAKVSPNGKVVELMPDAKAILAGAHPGMMGAGVDENALKQMVEGAFGELPEKAVAVGAKWKAAEMEKDQRVPFKNNIELTLTKCDADAFEVTAAGTVEQSAPVADDKDGDKDDPEAGEMREALKSMKVKNGKATGTQKVSRTDGFVVEANQVMTMDIEMTAGPMGEMQMAMKMTRIWKRATAEAATPKKAEKAEKAGAAKDGK